MRERKRKETIGETKVQDKVEKRKRHGKMRPVLGH